MAVTRKLEEEEEHRVERGERRREADPDNDVLVDELHAVRKVEGRAQREPQVHAVLRRLPRREQVAQRHGVEHPEALNDENDRKDVTHQNVEDRVAAAPVPVSVEEPLDLGARPRLRPRVARPKLQQVGLAARRRPRAGQLEAPAER